MYISELMEELQIILDRQGDCEIIIDVPERNQFCYDFDVIDKWYQLNYKTPNGPNNSAFILLAEEE